MVMSSLNLLANVSISVPLGVTTPLSFPVSATSGLPIRPRHALIAVEGNSVRWGKTPSGANGIIAIPGQLSGRIDFTDPNNDYTNSLQQINFVSLVGPATLQVQYMS